jgi:hypothetical protein
VAPVVLAWLAALACCLAAVLFGQSARDAPRRRRRARRRRLGLAVSLSGPWAAVLLAVAAGAATGAWLTAAAGAVAGVAVVALAGLALSPR